MYVQVLVEMHREGRAPSLPRALRALRDGELYYRPYDGQGSVAVQKGELGPGDYRLRYLEGLAFGRQLNFKVVLEGGKLGLTAFVEHAPGKPGLSHLIPSRSKPGGGTEYDEGEIVKQFSAAFLPLRDVESHVDAEGIFVMKGVLDV